MPTIIVDPEAAELVEAAVAMFEAALTARVKRADPDNVISNSLILQSHKLSTFRQMLALPEPEDFHLMPEPIRRKILNEAKRLVAAGDTPAAALPWRSIRGLAVRAGAV